MMSRGTSVCVSGAGWGVGGGKRVRRGALEESTEVRIL